jgi:hypothetical protein
MVWFLLAKIGSGLHKLLPMVAANNTTPIESNSIEQIFDIRYRHIRFDTSCLVFFNPAPGTLNPTTQFE